MNPAGRRSFISWGCALHWFAAACSLVLLSQGGCGPELKSPNGGRLSLMEYRSVALNKIEKEPGIEYEELVNLLEVLLRGQIMSMGDRAPDGDRSNGHRRADVNLRILTLHCPSHSEEVWLGSSHTMACRLEVYDSETATLLGSAKLFAAATPALGNTGLLRGGLLGVVSRAGPDLTHAHRIMLVNQMAQEVVKVLERARKAHP